MEKVTLAEFIRSAQGALKTEDFTEFNKLTDKFVKQAGGEGFSGFRVRRKPVRKSLKVCQVCGKGVKDLIAHFWRKHPHETALIGGSLNQ